MERGNKRAGLRLAVFLYQHLAARLGADGDFASCEKGHSEQGLPVYGEDIHFSGLPKPLH